MPNVAAGRFGRLAWLWLSVLVLVLDQASKFYFEGALSLYQQIVVIPDYFSWTLAYNTGAAFSFLADSSGWQRWLFALIAVVVSAVLVVWLKRLGRDETWLAIALALVLGGALGNLYDRIVLGHVVDFILVHWQNRWYFPAFNLADSAISVGAVMLALDMFKSKSPEKLSMTEIRIGQNTEVTLHFALHLENGDTVDSTFDKAPAVFKVGDGNLLPGFEAAIFGFKAGDKRNVTVNPENAFGQPNPQNVQIMPRSQFQDMELSEGLLVIFNDAANAELPGVVKAFDDAQVTVDFNHPLAGKTLSFEVEILEVKALLSLESFMQIKLANPRGFCAGVDRAIEIVNRALEVFGPPIYVRHEVVHNKFVVEDLRARGAIFVEELDQVPDDVIVIFSAHGVSQAVRQEAAGRGLKVFDATCPLVTKVHIEVARYSRDGKECILIGHAGHPEVEGTMGQYDPSNGGSIYLVEDEDDVSRLDVRNPDRLAFVTQTTLSMDDTSRVIDALRARFPSIGGPRKDDICYATQNRQDAVKQLADECDVVLVVGSPNSSNSNRLRELAERMSTPAYLIDGAEDLQRSWFDGVERIGITAGASAPEVLVRGVIQQLREWGASGAQELDGREENVTFSMPKELRVRSVT